MLASGAGAARERASAAADVVLATPGPGSAVSAIPTLARKIGADVQEGVALRLKFVDGGGIAIRELYTGNVQFGVFGITAAMNENLRAPRLVALAAVEDRVPLSLLVRTDLRDRVRRVEDLRGRVLGIHSNSLSTKTNGQQFLELVLRQHHVAPDSVRFVAAGQSWNTQSNALRSRLVDAVVSEEPFGLRLEQEGLAFALVRIGQADRPAGLPGEGFLRGTLVARADFVESEPYIAERMVRVIQRTLAWRREQGPEAIVTALELGGDEARAFSSMLQAYPDQFSSDGRFSTAQLRETEIFFRASSGEVPEGQRHRLEQMVIDRWAGRKP